LFFIWAHVYVLSL